MYYVYLIWLTILIPYHGRIRITREGKKTYGYWYIELIRDHTWYTLLCLRQLEKENNITLCGMSELCSWVGNFDWFEVRIKTKKRKYCVVELMFERTRAYTNNMFKSNASLKLISMYIKELKKLCRWIEVDTYIGCLNEINLSILISSTIQLLAMLSKSHSSLNRFVQKCFIVCFQDACVYKHFLRI